MSTSHIDGSIVFTNISGRDVRFFIKNPYDVIQSHHSRGEFYEPEELGIIKDFFPRGGVFVDIGTNVGNHTLYVCKFLNPRQVITFEPNPDAISLLRTNISLNDLTHLVDLSCLGVGLSDAQGKAFPSIPQNNLGATRMIDSDDVSALPLVRGDDMLQHRRIDFIKMDVEGMEVRALHGLEETIARWRPAMFIEVDERNAGDFDSWVQRNGYISAQRFRRYTENENHMIVPIERAV
ncbi:MAG TPA: FkbM family methyltransferase [Acidocella sp.]|jgi:FkbM family methyltransferase|uniref:FkbM family methyltransferase n=1 Tax=Acidocella sp. TaxID=50710 RepID=UPI002C1BBAC4|nr:FkbM family methyltransferase [Acidocella sp.]HVE20685.1 FkbM family methyltransferase [Acidocella sp.]